MSLIYMVPIFKGDSTLGASDYFDKIDSIAKLGRWEDSQKLAVAKLRMEGRSESYVRANFRVKSISNYTEFVQEIVREFRDVDNLSVDMARFNACVQLPGESVRVYADNIQLLGSKTIAMSGKPDDAERDEILNSVLQKSLISQFLSGIRGDSKRFVLSRCKNSKTFEEVVSVALEEEQNERLMCRPSQIAAFGNNSAPSFSVNTSNEETKPHKVIETSYSNDFTHTTTPQFRNITPQYMHRPRMPYQSQPRTPTTFGSRQLFRPIHRQPFSPRHQVGYRPMLNPIVCYNCGGVGHVRRVCPSRCTTRSSGNFPAFPSGTNGKESY